MITGTSIKRTRAINGDILNQTINLTDDSRYLKYIEAVTTRGFSNLTYILMTEYGFGMNYPTGNGVLKTNKSTLKKRKIF